MKRQAGACPNPSTIEQYIADHPDKPLRLRPLARALGVADEHYPAFRAAVRDLIERGRITIGRGRTLVRPAKRGEVTGTFRAHAGGFGFVETGGRTVGFVPPDATGGAHSGDRVEARVTRPGRRGTAPTVQIVRVSTRGQETRVGLLEREGTRWIVRPQREDAGAPLIVAADGTARPGDLVVVKYELRQREGGAPRGRIIETLGPAELPATRVRAVFVRNGYLDHVAPEVLAAADAAARISDAELTHERDDLRELLTLTIDPPDARDHDDAISIEELRGGHTRLGVHIADVAACVALDGVLDRHASERGNSLYLPGMVAPMLPEALSADACSLRPGEPRRTLSVFITYDPDGTRRATAFARSVIQSRAKLAYAEAAAALEREESALPGELQRLLRLASGLARRVQARRLRDGMISLQLPEPHVLFGAGGAVSWIGAADNNFAHTIIEMFMVEANEAVSAALHEHRITHLRRVHPEPESEGLPALAALARRLGIQTPARLTRSEVLELQRAVRGRPTEPAVHSLLLRSMAQAQYSTRAGVGHFALASEHYCHFTSPIRRYPDLINQRLLTHLLDRSPPQYDEDELDNIAEHCTATERRAQRAEREAIASLQRHFLRDRVGEICAALVSGVVRGGVFVQLQPYLADAFLPGAELGRGFEYRERSASFASRRGDEEIAVGSRLQVVIEAVDELREQILVRRTEGTPSPARRTAPKKRGHQEP